VRIREEFLFHLKLSVPEMDQKCDALDAFPGVSATYLGTGEEKRREERKRRMKKEELRISRQLMRQRLSAQCAWPRGSLFGNRFFISDK
jgi:hypothetical protein